MSYLPPTFELSVEEVDEQTAVVSVRGEIHLATAPEFSERLNDVIAEGRTAVVVDLTEVRETGTSRVLERTLATVTKPDLKGFWVHLDVDVLDDALMPAVDYRHPGGLTWQEAT